MTGNSSNGVQRQERRNRQIRYLAACGALLILATVIWLAVATAASAQSDGGSTHPGYITVDVREYGRDNAVRHLDFLVKWADPVGCSAGYNAYLSYTDDNDAPNRELIGSDADRSGTRSSIRMSNPGGAGHAVELYCGTYNVDSNENPVHSMPISAHHFCVTGDDCYQAGDSVTTYTTAPLLTSLAVSPGTLTPVFDKTQGNYTVPDVPHAQSQITVHVEEEIGYDIAFVKNPGSDVARSCSFPCVMSYGEGAVTLSDAEPALAGFQIDLDEGVNNLAVHIDPSPGWWNLQNGGAVGRLYGLTVTRAASDGSQSNTIPPTEIETGDTTTGESYMDVVVGYNTSPVGKSLSATWYDADNCSTDYNLYRHYAGYWDPETRGTVPNDDPEATDHLGGVSSGTDNASYSPSTYGPGVAFDVALYCGLHDPDSTGNLVASVWGIQKGGNHPWVGTYSSGATLLSLEVSPGTLTPTFQRNVTSYTIPDVANEEDQLTVHASEQLGYDTFFVRNRSWGFLRVCDVRGWNCMHGRAGEVLQDADLGAPGFQIDLDVGENTFSIHASPVLAYVANEFYDFTVTRLAPNNQAQGAPNISGIVQVGETLTVSTTDISDSDGLTNATYSYQWLSSRDTDIDGATGSTYILADSDASKTIKVRVDFTDDAGNQESLTSAATVAVAATVPGVPGSISVSVNDTEKLDVSWDAPDSNGGSAVTGYRVQWKEAADSWDIPANVSETTVTGTSHTATGLTDGVGYTFRVFAVNSAGDSPASEDESGTPRETTAPTVSSATVDGATLTVTFSEGLTETPLPAVTTFTVNVGDNRRGVNSVAISGSTVTLTLASAATSGDQVRVSYTAATDQAATRLMDLNENPAESFSGQAVTNNTAAAQTPLTASIHDEPSSHDGQSEFTFELRFSEELEGFSYQTLRGHAFTVTGGKVKGARRLAPPSNIRWQIKVGPTSNSDVTIVLPVTTDCDAQGAICTGGSRMLSSRLEVVFPGPTHRQNSQAQGVLTITGTVQVGETLTASTSGITDPDGLTNATFAYQWLSSRDTEIDGATGSTYVLAGSDAGKTIKVKVTFTDDTGNDETLISDATETILPRAFWEGALTVGEYTSAGTTWLGHSVFQAGFGAISLPRSVKVGQHFYTVQLIAHTATDLSLGISREIPEDFILQIGDMTFDSDDASRRQSTSSNIYSWQNATLDWSAGDDVSVALLSEAMAAARPANTEATGAPSISGSPTVGQTLTAATTGIVDSNGMNYAAFRYQWLSNDGTNDSEITDATGSTYTLVDADEGKHIKVRVSFTDLAQHKESVISTAVGPISPILNSVATGQPTISGTAQVGETLTASTAGISDSDGTTNATFAYQWLSSRDTDIDGATGSTYVLLDSDAGKMIKVRVTFTDDAGNEETLTSVATVAVAPTVPGAPGSLTVSVNDTGKLDVSWDAPDSNGGSTVTGYRVQWKEAADSWDPPADVSETTVTGTSHTVTGLTDGVGYTFRVFAVNTVGDSSASEEESGTPRETTAPTVSSATVDGATLTLTFSEGLTETPLPAVTTFTVNVGDNQREVNSVAISGSTVTLTLSYVATSTDAVSVGYTVPSDAAAARLKDLSANPAESFTGQTVTNNTAVAPPPLTASIHDAPTSHNGSDKFTFELRLSEEPKSGFSYTTIRDHAFTVTGGSVTGARRLKPPSNVSWQINVVPDSNGDVTIVLHVTTDCDAQGAICTGDGDGRPLSSRLEITVSGPTG